MEAVLRDILRTLAKHPDELRLTEVAGARTVIYELRCNPEDVGPIIGKNGKTISAIRILLNAFANPHGLNAVFEVIE